MVTIVGTGGDDTIDVDGDSGTLNGTPQGSPVDSINAGAGDDTVTINDSTIIGRVVAGADDDQVTVTDSTLNDRLLGGGGNDTISVSGSTTDRITGNLGNDDIIITDTTVTEDIRAGGQNDNVTVRGSTVEDILLGGGSDELTLISTDVSGIIQGNGGVDTLNLPAGTVVNDATFGTFPVVAGVPYSLSSGTFTLPSGITNTYNSFNNGTGFPCFTYGTLIETEHGPRPVQDIRIGDQIPTQENGLQTVRWIGRRKLLGHDLAANPKLNPVRIVAGALGDGLPTRDLLVSRQHRMLVRSKIVQRMFDCHEVLIPAIKLTDLPGVFVENVEEVEYFHLLFDRHEVITAEGAPTESLFTGPEALKALGEAARQEILTLFPEVAELDYTPEPARFIPPGKRQKELIARHMKNRKQLLAPV